MGRIRGKKPGGDDSQTEETRSDYVPDVSPDTEVRLIRENLERKFSSKFKSRVKVDGYLDEMNYCLVLNNYESDDTKDWHSLWGGRTHNVLDVNKSFAVSYWENIRRAKEVLSDRSKAEALSSFERERHQKALAEAVAESREEMLLRAAVEGRI